MNDSCNSLYKFYFGLVVCSKDSIRRLCENNSTGRVVHSFIDEWFYSFVNGFDFDVLHKLSFLVLADLYLNSKNFNVL
jgi:hypothetical protein